MVCSGVSSRILCTALYLMLHASRVVATSLELLYGVSLDDSSVFFGHNLQQGISLPNVCNRHALQI